MKIIGHRGARGLGPENTLPSLKAALEAGVDEIEIDVRVTADGACVLNHDPYLHDASGGKLRALTIAQHTAAQLYDQRPDTATLAEAIRLVNHRVPMVIEVKPKVPAAPVIAQIQQFLDDGWQPHDFLLASFSHATLTALHAALPAIETVVLSRVSGIRARWRAKRVNATRLAFNHHNLWWGFIAAMHKRGYQIVTYTLNDPAKAERWKRHGLYGVVTDYPDRFISKKAKKK
jgi:glycerophosphoryl diester phosphodiesterase